MNFVYCSLLVIPLVTAFHPSPALSRYGHRFRTESSKWTSLHRRNNSLMSFKNHQGNLPRLPPPDDSERDGEIPTSKVDGQTRAVIGDVASSRKITLSFTCNLCEHRTTRAINRVSYTKGIVVVWCEGCGQKHLIADNLGKMDFPWFGRNIEEYMAQKGTPVKRLLFDESGIGSVEARLPGVHFPHGENPGEEGFVGKVILPDTRVNDVILPDVPRLDIGEGERDVAGDAAEGLDEESTEGPGS